MRVKLSTYKDANFEPGQFVQIMGKKGIVKLDKKSVHKLAKTIRSLTGKGQGMGWSFTAHESVNEGNPYGLTYKKGKTVKVTHKTSGKELVIIDNPRVRKEYEKIGFFAEGKLNEGAKVVRLPNGIKVKIEFKGLTFIGGTKPVFLDRTEMMNFFKATSKYLKEGKLKESWKSPQGYSSREAGKVIDGALRNYAKDLRKVEGRVIKDWMTKAKAGVIDYFDLVRGLTTGDISRAHPYEVEFLHKVLLRDKIVQRFRSYFGGKKGKPERTKKV